MSTYLSINIVSNDAYTKISGDAKLTASAGRLNLVKLSQLLAGMASGATDFSSGTVDVVTTAKALVTFTGAASNNETLTINGVTFTAKTSGAVAANGEFNLSATVATQATNLAAAIAAVTDARISGIVTASASLGVVTVSAVYPSYACLGYDITENMTNTAVTAWALDANKTQTTI